MDNRLLRLKVDIDEKQPIIQLKNDIAAFAGKLELNAAGEKIKNNTNIDNIDVDVPFGKTWVNTKYPATANPNPNGSRRISYKRWWTGLQVQQVTNIQEKMVLFWHNHLATEDSVTELEPVLLT